MLVVFLYGRPATGKKTIGTLLSSRTELPLFHNHLTVDLAKSLFELFSPGFVSLRSAIWRSAFREAGKNGRSFIFTFCPETSVEGDLISDLVGIIEEYGRVSFIELQCAKTEILTRLPNDDRATKLNDPNLYEDVDQQGGFDFDMNVNPCLVLHTDRLSPEDAVAKIIDTLDLQS